MTIEGLSNKVIKDIKAWPDEARQSQDNGVPKTSWDEYKEQVQYEEYDSFEVFEETIESMVRDDVSDLSEKAIEDLYHSIHRNNYSSTLDEKREHIIDSVLGLIKSEAESQDIEYSDIEIEHIRYKVDDLIIVAEVLSKVSPEEFQIEGYSEATGPSGEQGIANLSVLDEENGLEWITPEEFERARNSIKVGTEKSKLMTDKERIMVSVKEIIKLRAIAQKKHPRQVIQEMKGELEEMKAKKKNVRL